MVLDRGSNYTNSEREHKYRRTIVFVTYSQRIFFANQEESVMQDNIMTVDAKITRTDFVESYYTDRKWKKVVPTNFKNLVKSKYFSIELSNG